MNAGYIALGLCLLVFLGLQFWWVGMTMKNGRGGANGWGKTGLFDFRSQQEVKPKDSLQSYKIRKQLEETFSKSP